MFFTPLIIILLFAKEVEVVDKHCFALEVIFHETHYTYFLVETLLPLPTIRFTRKEKTSKKTFQDNQKID